MLLSVACSDDDGIKSVSKVYEFVTVKTGLSKIVLNIITDDGKVWYIKNAIETDACDSTLRCICGYVADGNKMDVYYLKNIFSPFPIEASRYKSRPTDPLNIVSLWNSGGYLNMHLGIMTTDNDVHAFGFCQDSIADGKVFVTLLHKQPENDPESYTQDAYLSMPLKNYSDQDSVILKINTYKGLRQMAFAL